MTAPATAKTTARAMAALHARSAAARHVAVLPLPLTAVVAPATPNASALVNGPDGLAAGSMLALGAGAHRKTPTTEDLAKAAGVTIDSVGDAPGRPANQRTEARRSV